jgi:4-oxalocrotonate tautomerase
MPHVTIKLYPTGSEEIKIKLAEEITKVIMNVVNKPEGAISIDIQEVEETAWMDEVYDKEIKPNMDKLYKKPGY